METTLRYGSNTSSLAAATNPLRQAAERNGIILREASPVDLAAAAYGAEQWCHAFRTRTLDYPGVHGEEAVMALAAILSRASGQRQPTGIAAPCLPQDDIWEQLTDQLPASDRWEVARRVLGDLGYGKSEVLRDWVRLRFGSPTAGVEETAGA